VIASRSHVTSAEDELNSRARLTCLDYINADVIEARINLLAQELRRDLVDAEHARGVLRRQRRRCRHGVAAMGGDDLLIGLKPTVQKSSQPTRS